MTEGPDYIHQNALAAEQPLPAFYWTADTEMNCLHHAIKQTLDTGYAHHIQRLMVTGLLGCYMVLSHKLCTSGIWVFMLMPLNGWNHRTR